VAPEPTAVPRRPAFAPPTFAPPTVALAGSTDPRAPLVVLLHGRGSHEAEIITLAELLPAGPQYVAVRAPLAEGPGFAWFANRGIGRPLPDSLAATMGWFRSWLDEVAPGSPQAGEARRPVVVVGFSGGAAFAGGLLLADPRRFAGVAVLYGTLPFDAGVAVDEGRLRDAVVFVARGQADTVIPADLLDRTWAYLQNASGADVSTHLDPGGHSISRGTLEALNAWLSTVLLLTCD
jgi:phospholipase/carboxylesterase